MAANSTLLCIHRDPAQLSVLQENGYELVTATNGGDGLRLFMSRIVDAIVIEYHLGLLDGSDVAAEIKQVQPTLPVIMVADNVALPDGALKAVDAFVAKSDGPQFLLATVHSVLHVKPARRCEEKLKSASPILPGRSREGARGWQSCTPQSAIEERDLAFSPRVWRSIRNGSVRFRPGRQCRSKLL